MGDFGGMIYIVPLLSKQVYAVSLQKLLLLAEYRFVLGIVQKIINIDKHIWGQVVCSIGNRVLVWVWFELKEISKTGFSKATMKWIAGQKEQIYNNT